jgi:WD40 repeat protein
VFATPTTVISISLSGTLNIFDLSASSASEGPSSTLHGATKAITASALVVGKYYAGSFDGTIKAFEDEKGGCEEVGKGEGHTARVAAIAGDGKGKIWTAGWDDRVLCIENGQFRCVMCSDSVVICLRYPGCSVPRRASFSPPSVASTVHRLLLFLRFRLAESLFDLVT